MVRVHAFDLIVKLPDNIPILNDPEFVENVLMKTALAFCNSPKAMIAEGGALLLKLIFQKCLKHVKFVKSNSRKMAQLEFFSFVQSLIKERLATFTQSLIKEGKTTSLLHGLIGFFKQVFAEFKVTRKDF